VIITWTKVEREGIERTLDFLLVIAAVVEAEEKAKMRKLRFNDFTNSQRLTKHVFGFPVLPFPCKALS
jgi:hypothetical protein